LVFQIQKKTLRVFEDRMLRKIFVAKREASWFFVFGGYY
jgi:hypothetical protein